MSRVLQIDNYIIEKPLIEIVYDIQRVLTNGKLKDVIEKGDNIVVSCPSNQHKNGLENRPSLNIFIGDDEDIPYGWARCFTCGFNTDFVHFVAEAFDRSYDFAKNWLISRYGKQAYEKKVIVDSIKIKEPDIFKKANEKTGDEKLLETYESYCPYLAKRRISRETAEKFGVKYDPANRQVVFPIRNEYGKLVMLARRSIDSKIFNMTKDVEKPVYCLDYVIKNHITTVAITEGPVDVLSAYENGYNAIGTLGQPSIEQIKKINNSGIKVLYLCMDNDASGRAFNKFIKSYLSPRILTVDVVWPANKKDINDLTRDELKKLIESGV